MQVLSVRGNPFRSTPWFDREATGRTFSATARLLAQQTNRAKKLFSVVSSWLAPQCKVDERTMPSREIPSVQGWAGVSLATNLGIQSGPHLSAEGDSDDQPAEGNSGQTSTGCGILTQSILGLETERESRAATALLLLLLLSSCFLHATSHRAAALLTRSRGTHPLPQHTHAHRNLASKLTHTPLLSVSPSR